jgi:hypothetical protein
VTTLANKGCDTLSTDSASQPIRGCGSERGHCAENSFNVSNLCNELSTAHLLLLLLTHQPSIASHRIASYLVSYPSSDPIRSIIRDSFIHLVLF